VKEYLGLYKLVAYDGIERVAPAELCLSVTAALEHYTAILAEGALRDRFLDAAHPALRDLLLWHAAEEIEHKAVAFDVLRRVNPGYGLRVAGMALATVTLAGFWAAATLMFLAEDGALDRASVSELRRAREAAGMPERSIARDVFLAGLLSYLRPDFHPTQIDNEALARDYLAGAFAGG
jgi:predicted metal-dependent hydrolase